MDLHIWSPERYWEKAVVYLKRASNLSRDDEMSVLFHVFALEFLARAALSSVHPTLNADPQGDGAHLLYACGLPSERPPKSLPVHAVFGRLARIDKEFKVFRPVCDYLTALRNSEMHSGATPFAGLSSSKWLAQYYGACLHLCGRMNRQPVELFGSDAAPAVRLAKNHSKEVLKKIRKRIAARRTLFEELPEAERARRVKEANSFAHHPHQAECPACSSPCERSGELFSASDPKYSEGKLFLEHSYLTSGLSCRACGLVLVGIDECLAAEVAPQFTETFDADLHYMHEDEDYREYDNM